nr:MAG TPA: hypothetical protein [Caudoviricetes sp.]
MMKIDTTKIEGYDTMTPEEKIAALEAFQYDDREGEVQRLKTALTKSNSDAADWKRKHNALLSEDERRKQERDEELESLRSAVADMKREKLVSDYRAQFLSLGYDDALASDTAAALADGNIAKVFANQAAWSSGRESAVRAEMLRGQERPPVGTGTGERTVTLEDLRRMPQDERWKFSNEHPEEYAKIYDGGK